MSDFGEEKEYPDSEQPEYDEDDEREKQSEGSSYEDTIPEQTRIKYILSDLAISAYLSCRAEMIGKTTSLEDEKNILPTVGVIDYLVKNNFELADVKPYEIAVLEILIKDNPLCLRIDGFAPLEECFIPLTMACFSECREKFRIPQELLRSVKTF